MSQSVIITGANSGLGFALAKRFVKAGDRVYGISKTKRNWSYVKSELADSGHFFLYQLDVTSEPKVRKWLKNFRRKVKKIDILINSAGYSSRPTPVEKLSVKEFQKNISANLFSAFLMCKYALPIFKSQKQGLIINIASMAGKRAVPNLAAYSASKFGVLALSQSIAKENPNAGFKCITVCPGGMNTIMRVKLFGKADAERQQSPDYVADIILKIVQNKISVESGGDIIIRHGKIAAINPKPAA